MSTAHSADDAARRRDQPGTMHLLRWRAIELALAERRTEMDLGGVDVAGARRPPEPGEPTHGLYEHKRSFGATWVELAGAHERVARPWRYAAGRVTARIARGSAGPGKRRVTSPEPTVQSLIAAAEPSDPLPLGELVARLEAHDLVRGAWVDDALVRRSPVRGVTEDSRAVGAGTLFVAVPGFHVDGHDYLDRAAAAGAAAAIVEHPVPGARMPQLVVAAARPSLARAAAWWYRDPSHEIATIGVTGTDGKTTTSFLAVAALEAAGISTGLIGTVETRVGAARDRHEAHVTTPAAPELQATLRAMRLAGNAAAVVETTSHALELDRVLDVAYDIALFTNLTHEHLELHGSFERYRAAKLRLFERLGAGPENPVKTIAGRAWPKAAIVNRDDPAAPWFEAAARAAGAQVVTYGIGSRRGHPGDGRRRGRPTAPGPLCRAVGRWRPRPSAGRQVQRPQRAGGRRAGRGPAPRSRRRPCRARGRHRRARTDGADRRRPAVRRDRRLRAFAGVAPGRARPAGPDRDRPRAVA